MKNLCKAVTKNNRAILSNRVKSFHTQLKESEGLTRIEKYTLNRKTPYIRDRVSQVESRLKSIYDNKLNEKLEVIERIKNAPDKLPNNLTLIINFYKSKTWGYCPKGSDNYGNETRSITGCGYCKESTATAQLLNQNDIILKRLYKAKNKPSNINKSNCEALGYGSGYGIVPSFEGGVGVNCHVRILEGLGYKVTLISNDRSTVLVVSEK